jgi:hypothetical protein
MPSIQNIPLKGPWKGIISDSPAPSDPQAFDDVLNFFMRKGRIQSRPRFNPFLGAPPDGSLTRNWLTFQDVANAFHTLEWTAKSLYALTAPGGVPTRNLIAAFPQPNTNLPYATEISQGQVWFANGSDKLAFVDGELAGIQHPADVNVGSAFFMTQLAAHLVLANTIEPAPGNPGSFQFPTRVRWSKSGDYTIWDPTTEFTAGFTDLQDVPDDITGLKSLSQNTAAIWRTNGITLMYATGLGVAPFNFQNYARSPVGIGNIYPYSIDIYNNSAVFVAFDDIYTFDGTNLGRIAGGLAKKAIFTDLDSAAGDVVRGTVIPSFGPGFDFASYWLSIPGPNVTWIYMFEEQKWVRMNSTAGRLTALAQVATS